MSKKLITRVSEGLGNQLFMYANSLALSKKINFDFYIDNESAFQNSKNIRSYFLDNFNISAEIIDTEYKFNTPFRNIKRKLRIKLDQFKDKKNFLIESKDSNKKTFYYDLLKNFNFSETLYVEGNFESEKYFINERNIILKEFSLKKNFLYDNKYLNDFKKSNVISICIRQNRFSERVGNNKSILSINKSNKFVMDTINYVRKAESFIEKKINNPVYYIWSNDFSNLREYFPEKKYNFVENDNEKVISDFFLFNQCKYFIVGPTTFHWWGAWLSDFNDKICLRPRNLNPSNNIDFWPKDWISI